MANELVQEPNEDLEHFVRRVIDKWESQGKILVDGEVLAEFRNKERGGNRNGS